MNLLLRLSQGIDRLNAAVGKAMGWATVLMVLLGAWNAVARYVGPFVGLNLSSNAYIEAQWYLFSLVFLLGAGWTLEQDKHVRVDVIYGRLSDRSKAWIDLVGALLLLLPFCVWALQLSLPAVRNSWSVLEVSPDPGGLPRYPLKTVIPVAFGLLFLQGLSFGLRRALFLLGAAPPPGQPLDDAPAAEAA